MSEEATEALGRHSGLFSGGPLVTRLAEELQRGFQLFVADNRFCSDRHLA